MKLKRLLDLFIDGRIPQDEYQPKRTELLEEKQRLYALIASAEHNLYWMDRAAAFFNQARNIYETFKNGDLAVKTEVVRQIGWNLTLKDYILHWKYKKRLPS